MSETQELDLDTPPDEEIAPIAIPLTTRTVYTDNADPEIVGLHGKAKRGKLVVQPDFQRHFVWDRTKASRLIESALLSIPIPIIYISEEPDNKEYVIDGQQRPYIFFFLHRRQISRRSRLSTHRTECLPRAERTKI